MNGIVIGGGAVGVDFHLPRMLNILKCSSIVIVEVSEHRCAQLKKKFSRDSRISILSAIPDRYFDLAVIATPPKFHLEVFESIVNRCPAFIIEKPLAKTVAEGHKIIELAKEHKVKVAVGLIRRTLDNFFLLKEWMNEEMFGALQSVQVNEGSIFSWNAISLGSFSRDLNGGGVLMDTGPHTIDQIFQVFDALELKNAQMDALPSASSKAIEANAYLSLLANSSIPITMSISRNRAFSNTAVFEFSQAKVTLGLHNNSIQISSKSGKYLSGYPGDITSPMTYSELFDAFYEEIVAKDDENIASPKTALKSQKLIEQAYVTATKIKGGF